MRSECRHKVARIDQAESLCQMYLYLSNILVVFSYIGSFLALAKFNSRHSLLIISLISYFPRRVQKCATLKATLKPVGVVLDIPFSLGRTIICRTIRISLTVLFKSSLLMVFLNLNKTILQTVYLTFIFFSMIYNR